MPKEMHNCFIEGYVIMKKMKLNFNVDTTIHTALSVMFLLIFVPVLFCIFVYGNTMNYHDTNKLIALWGNKRLSLFSILILVLFVVMCVLLKRVQFNRKLSIITLCSLGVAFVALYFINEEICKCIWFKQGWDVDCVVGTAYNLAVGHEIGDDVYYSMYPNNVPMAFILGQIYQMARNTAGYPYPEDFLWMQTICGLISLAGMATCVTIKKVTNNVAAVLAGFILFVASIGISPWKTAPYTDMFALLFPIFSLCFYVYYYHAGNKVVRYLLFFLCYLAGAVGAMIKPPVLIVLIAVTMLEVIYAAPKVRTEWKELLIKACMIVVVVLLYKGAQGYIYKDTGYIQNKDISATYYHYMLMGLNEDTTGSYYSPDVALIGNYPDPQERLSVQKTMIAERMKEKGFGGYLNFLLRKTVMTFNDGAFGWGREGGCDLNAYRLLSKGTYSFTLRNIFWPLHKYSIHFNTYCQIVWLAIIFAVPGICLGRKGTDKRLINTILLTILGITLYLMLFEARARYLICFVPVFVLAASVGITRYYEVVKKVIVRGITKIIEST